MFAKTIKPLLISAAIIISFFIGKYLPVPQNNTVQESRHSGYKYISPLLFCDSQVAPPNPKIIRVKQKILQYLESQPDIKTSIYFRHLNNGPVFGINEYDSFSPASLLKVPIMISIFKLHELSSTSILDQKILVKDLPTIDTAQPPISNPLIAQQEYSIEELVRRMIVYSDNQSTTILKQFLGQDRLFTTYTDLGLDLPNSSLEDPLSTKGYSSIYRILYNASYLNRALSEKALSLLTQTTFNQGLSQGLPADVSLAHKFGERSTGSEHQLHDCGIVYYSQNPYFLCIMTKGTSSERQSKLIGWISQAVYQEITSQ